MAGDLGAIRRIAGRGQAIARSTQLVVDLRETGRGDEVAVRADDPVRDVVDSLVLVLVLDERSAHSASIPLPATYCYAHCRPDNPGHGSATRCPAEGAQRIIARRT